MKRLEFHKILHLKHSGGTHVVVMNEFRKSIADGESYCRVRGWDVKLTDGTLTVQSKAVFGFYFYALISIVSH